MHSRVLTGLFSTAWAWLKGVIGKLSPKGILLVIRKKGDELNVLFSTHDAETIVRLLQGAPAALLKQLPAALGGPDYPTAPDAAAYPEPLPPQLTYFY